MSTGGIQRVRRVSVVDEVVEQLTRRIVAGEWSPGSALPGLRVFAAQLGVSTLTVGQAIRTLQARGLVESRHGAGTFVRSPDPDDGTVPWMLSPTETDEYLELIEARRVIEGELVRLAAQRRTDQQMDKLRQVVAAMAEARLDAATFLEADLQFHIALAEAANNRILLRTMLAIRGPLKRLIANRTFQHLEEVGSLDASVADHQRIVDGLAAGDAGPGAAALAHMTERGEHHLRSLRDDEVRLVGTTNAAPEAVPRPAGGDGA